MTAQPWKIKGEFVVSCSCAVFWPCVISLGEAPPTDGTCQGWIAIHVDEGYYGKARLDGLNAAWMVDVPGRMPEGNWGFALYIDERATPEQADGLTKINMGEAGGSTSPLKQLIGSVLGIEKVPFIFEKLGKGRRFAIPGVVDATVEPVRGKNPDEPTKVVNSEYWPSSTILVCRGVKSKSRAFGREWDLAGKSGEICDIEWGTT